MKRTFRQSQLATFLRSPSDFLKQYKAGGIKPNEAMKFGTAQHAIREKENGEYGEINIIIDFDFCFLSGTLDLYNREIIKDYKYTQNINKWEGYKMQVAIYQYLVWKRDNVLVPAVLEMNEVLSSPFADQEFSLTGVIKEYPFKPPTKKDLLTFEKKIISALKQMCYLVDKLENPPKRPKSNYTKEQLIEMSEMLPDEMRTKNFIRNK